MITKVDVDLNSLGKHMEDITKSSFVTTVQAVKQTWADEASKKLNTTARHYIDNIKVKMSLGVHYNAEIYLDSEWSNKLENGFPAYDMKSKFASSSSIKRNKDGDWYLVIPMRHTAPSATGREGKPMPNAVYNRARRLPQWGRATSGVPSNYKGITKVPESSSSTRSAYYTYRTVGENSPSSAFRHPGFDGVHIADGLSSQIEDTFSKVFEANMSNIDNRGR